MSQESALRKRAGEVRERLPAWHPGLAVELVEHIVEVIIDPTVDEMAHETESPEVRHER